MYRRSHTKNKHKLDDCKKRTITMKKNVIKRLTSTVLAAVMVASIGFASFAATTDDDEVFPTPNTDTNQEGWIITTEEAGGLGAVQAVVTASDATTGTITYNNIRNAISPTGVILRYAPYIIMIAAAAVIVVMAVKSKKKNEEEA